MHIRIDHRVLEQFPDTCVGCIVAYAPKGFAEHESITRAYQAMQEHIAHVFQKDTYKDHPAFTAWRAVYEATGISPKKHVPSCENMVGRILKSGPLRSVLPVVDAYNTYSLKYLVPAGADDLDRVSGDIVLRYATADDAPVRTIGAAEPEKLVPGEIVYADDQGIMCRSWNWRQADRTKVHTDTKTLVIMFDGVDGINPAYIQSATAECAETLAQICGAQVGAVLLSKDTPQADLRELLNKEARVVTAGIVPVYDIRHHAEQALSMAEHEARAGKVRDLHDAGVSVWPEAVAVPHTLADIRAQFSDDHTASVVAAGRIMSIREHGKALFATIQDRTQTLQLYLRADELGQSYTQFLRTIDEGDYIRCEGTLFKTQRGELSVHVQAYQLLAKCLHPLPDTFHGLQDVETRYRQRYLDLIANPDVRHRFATRSRIVATIRRFLDTHSFLEVETPMLHPIPGGAAARPFVTHHNALGMDFYLRIAPELYLKRLVVGGFERVYEINRNFRNEGVSTRHNPEFTMLEMYLAHHDYHHMMNFIEELLRAAVALEHPSLVLEYGSYTIDFSRPFRRISPYDAVKEYAGLSDHDLSEGCIDDTARRLSVEIQPHASYNRKVFALFEACAEKHLIQPTFLIDFPIELSPLAKRDPADTDKAARFELFIAGMEIANGFNELNDPYDQAARFKEQAQAHAAGDDEAMHYDADYVTALEYGLPPCVGAGIGIDRLVMLITNTTTIKDVILFPSLKRKAV